MSPHDPVASVAPITGPDLCRIMDDQRVVRSGRALSAAAYAKLADGVTELRDMVALGRGVFRQHDALTERCAGALATLADVLPALRREYECERAELEALDKLTDAVRVACGRPWAQPPGDGGRLEKWKDVAEALERDFRDAVASTNPGLKLGLSNDGPVARFVTAMIPHVTDERPTCDAVARCLQRETQKRRKAAA
jgi:hypothetical protein